MIPIFKTSLAAAGAFAAMMAGSAEAQVFGWPTYSTPTCAPAYTRPATILPGGCVGPQCGVQPQYCPPGSWCGTTAPAVTTPCYGGSCGYRQPAAPVYRTTPTFSVPRTRPAAPYYYGADGSLSRPAATTGTGRYWFEESAAVGIDRPYDDFYGRQPLPPAGGRGLDYDLGYNTRTDSPFYP